MNPLKNKSMGKHNLQSYNKIKTYLTKRKKNDKMQFFFILDFAIVFIFIFIFKIGNNCFGITHTIMIHNHNNV